MNLWQVIDSRGNRATFYKLMTERAGRATSLYSKNHTFGNILQGILIKFLVALTIMEVVQHLPMIIIIIKNNHNTTFVSIENKSILIII